jgi:hypothetical protein
MRLFKKEDPFMLTFHGKHTSDQKPTEKHGVWLLVDSQNEVRAVITHIEDIDIWIADYPTYNRIGVWTDLFSAKIAIGNALKKDFPNAQVTSEK